MAPLIDTSLREYALSKAREHERHGDYHSSIIADEWLGLQDWTESPETLAPFDDAYDHIRAAFKMIHDAYQTENDTEFTRELCYHIEHASDRIEDARALITNVQRKEVRPIA